MDVAQGFLLSVCDMGPGQVTAAGEFNHGNPDISPEVTICLHTDGSH